MPEVALTMTPAILSYANNLDTGMKVSIPQMMGGTKGVSTFPAPWAPESSNPYIRVIVQNNSLTAPIAPVLVTGYTDQGASPPGTMYTIKAELSTVQPGQTLGNGAGEIVQGIPLSQMYLACWYIGIGASDVSAGFTVNVSAFAG